MTYSEFEKNAARKINQYASGVDGEALWTAIQPHVPSAGKRRRGFFWLFFAGLIVVAGSLYWLDPNPGNPGSGKTTLSIAPVSSESPSEKTGPKDKVLVGDEKAKDRTMAVPSKESIGSVKNRHANLGNFNEERQRKQIKNRAVLTETPETNPVLKITEPDVSMVTDPGTATPGVEKSGEQPTTGSVALSGEKNERADETIVLQNEDETEPERITNDPPTVEEEAISMIERMEEPVEEEENADKGNELAPPARDLDLNFGFGVYGGISRSTAELELKEGTDPVYLQSRLNSEKQLETLHLGIEVLAQTNKKLYFRTGLQYSRIARKFTIDAERISFDTIPDGIQAIYVNTTTNDTIIVYGEVIKQTRTNYNKATYNYFHLLDVPLLAGYTFENDEWSIGVEAGAVFNVSNQSKGEIFDLNSDFYDIKTDSNKWYKTNIGVGFMAGLSAAYKLDHNFQIYLSPTFRLGSVFSTDKNPLKQSHASLGVNAGVRYFLD